MAPEDLERQHVLVRQMIRRLGDGAGDHQSAQMLTPQQHDGAFDRIDRARRGEGRTVGQPQQDGHQRRILLQMPGDLGLAAVWIVQKTQHLADHARDRQ